MAVLTDRTQQPEVQPATRASPADPRTSAADGWTVVCLCAAWCRTCEAFQPAFAAHAQARPQWRLHWVDIEDEADRLGDLDVDTFPTLLVLRAGGAHFFGPIVPQVAAIDTLLRSLDTAPAPRAELQPLAAAVTALLGATATAAV